MGSRKKSTRALSQPQHVRAETKLRNWEHVDGQLSLWADETDDEEVNGMCASCERNPATHGEVCCQCYEPGR